MAAEVGYPLMLKASWGGGGRGMRVIETEDDLAPMMELAKHEALAAFGNDEVYLETLIRSARHVGVQILGDQHGNLVHLFERDGSVQRRNLQPRNQKVAERAPVSCMDEATRQELCASVSPRFWNTRRCVANNRCRGEPATIKPAGACAGSGRTELPASWRKRLPGLSGTATDLSPVWHNAPLALPERERPVCYGRPEN